MGEGRETGYLKQDLCDAQSAVGGEHVAILHVHQRFCGKRRESLKAVHEARGILSDISQETEGVLSLVELCGERLERRVERR